MKITNEWLIDKRACSEGRDWFNANCPNGGDLDIVLRRIVHDASATDSWVTWLMRKADCADVSWLEGLSVGGSLYLSGTQITETDVPAQFKGRVLL